MSKSKIDTLNRLWRPLGAWGIVINLTALPPGIYFMALFGRGDQHIPALIGLVATLGGWFVAMAAVRQVGKNKALDVEENITIAGIEDES